MLGRNPRNPFFLLWSIPMYYLIFTIKVKSLFQCTLSNVSNQLIPSRSACFFCCYHLFIRFTTFFHQKWLNLEIEEVKGRVDISINFASIPLILSLLKYSCGLLHDADERRFSFCNPVFFIYLIKKIYVVLTIYFFILLEVSSWKNHLHLQKILDKTSTADAINFAFVGVKSPTSTHCFYYNLV